MDAVKKKNIIKILKEGLYSIKVLYLKDLLLTNSMINCDSKIIISTRIDFSLKLINYNEYSSIKIAQEHIYHNNNDKYLNKLYKILSKIDYLMPSSNYLTEYYKDLFIDYRYKIKTNDMYVETDNKISKLKNKNIISVGRLEKVKAFDELIKIFKTVHEKNPDWTLSIVGSGSEYDNLNNLINELNLKDSVKLLGNKDKDELNKLYSETSIYVMTSIEESFGLVLLEAASHGLPIISYSRALGAKEIIKNNGILIDNENDMINNINKLIDNIDLRKEYQNKSLKISEYYSYEFVEKNNLEFYKNLNKNTIFTNLYLDSQNNFYKLVDKNAKNKEKMFIVTANPETYMLSLKDKEINDIIYNKNNYIIPDGTSIVESAKLFDLDINERIAGIDLSTHLLELSDKNKYKVYLFGAKESVMDKLETVINTKYPNIKLVGSTNGYVQDKDTVFEYIKSVKPDIVLLGLGIPLQEKLINKHINSFNKGIFVGVGGSFDVLSGDKLRAPKIFIKLNLEWLYRIIKEPKRITRFLKYNVKYVFKIIKEKSIR